VVADRVGAWKCEVEGVADWIGGRRFFVFAAHEPLQTVVRKVSYRLFSPTAGASVLALYLLTPVCMIALLVIVHRCLLKIMPRFTGVITGNTYRVGQQRA